MEKLIADIDAFCAAHDMARSTFGKLALNDKPFVARIASGRRIWPETEARVRAFMAAYKKDAA